MPSPLNTRAPDQDKRLSRFNRMKTFSDTVAGVQRAAVLNVSGALMLSIIPQASPTDSILLTAARWIAIVGGGSALLFGHILLGLVSLYISATARELRGRHKIGSRPGLRYLVLIISLVGTILTQLALGVLNWALVKHGFEPLLDHHLSEYRGVLR